MQRQLHRQKYSVSDEHVVKVSLNKWKIILCVIMLTPVRRIKKYNHLVSFRMAGLMFNTV